MSNPWLKFYPSDWRADPALRMCSLAARGLWMEMLCIMHEADPRGSLVVNGKALNERQLAALSGSTLDELRILMSELEDAGVFSLDPDGTIYSRRIRRDVEKAAQDKANGGKGGNPTLKAGVNPPDKAQKPEARSQIDVSKETSVRAKRADTGSRLPEDWKPDDDLLRFCRDQGLSPSETQRLTEEFVNYWTALPGSKARKLDWPKTYRNRVLEVVARRMKFAPIEKPLIARPEVDRSSSVWVSRGSDAERAWEQARGPGFLAARKKDRPGFPDGGYWLPSEFPTQARA